MPSREPVQSTLPIHKSSHCSNGSVNCAMIRWARPPTLSKWGIRIEGLRRENIRYVAPQSSITRLTFGWPLLYLFLVLMQVGLNPFVHPAFLLWLGLPLVLIGSFLLSISEVRSKHVFWQTVFSEEGEGSSFARLVTAVAGWLLVIFPHLFLLLDSINRLRVFRIPPEPF